MYKYTSFQKNKLRLSASDLLKAETAKPLQHWKQLMESEKFRIPMITLFSQK